MAHKDRTHAVLSASSSKQWLNCPPSAKLNAEIPDITTEYAKEGTDAHELAEYKVNQLLDIKADNQPARRQQVEVRHPLVAFQIIPVHQSVPAKRKLWLCR